MLLSGFREPLGHELLNEARASRGDNDRSALVIAVTALEVRVKEFIIRRVPAAEWLVTKAPSPPIEAILCDYFAELGCPVMGDEALRRELEE